MDASDYTEYRPLMFSIAYRMTGSVGDAEDIVQEAFLRLASGAEPSSPKAYLATITTRLAIDHLRSARVRRESYVGTWLPEPLLGDDAPGPAELAETSDSLSMAFLVLLETLSPAERAVFLLREAFGYPVFGRDRVWDIIRLQIARTIELGASLRAEWVNGQPGVLAYDSGGGLIAVIVFDVLDGQVQAIRAIANPEKLRHLGPVSRIWHLRWREEHEHNVASDDA